MTVQTHLFDADRAEAAKQEAIDHVATNAEVRWRHHAMRAVYAICRRRLQSGVMEFTTDAVTALLQRWGIPDPNEPRAMGGVMRNAALRDWCTVTDRMEKSADMTCHRRKKQVWRVNPHIADWDGR